MKVLVITVNYNNSEVTNEMVNNLLAIDKAKCCKIIIVDNNSSDKDKLNRNNVDIIFLEENIGYFPAINVALNKISVSNYDYIIPCNNDLIFSDDFFSELEKLKIENNVFSISPQIQDLDNFNQNPVLVNPISKYRIIGYDIYYSNYYLGQVIYSLWQLLKGKKKNFIYPSGKILLGYGAIYVLSKSFFSRNKLLDSPPFLMGEEAFLAWQIKETGGIEYYETNLKVQHKEHSTCKKLSKKKMYYITKESYKLYRNKLRLLK